MSSISLNIPSLGALADNGTRTPAQSLPQTSNPTPDIHPPQTRHHSDAKQKVADDLRATVYGDTTHPLNNIYSSFSNTLPSGGEYHVDNYAIKIAKATPSAERFASLRAVELNLPKNEKREGDKNGLSSSGIRPTWLENHGSLIGKNGAGVKLDGDRNDDVVNAGLIKGTTVALDMGGGNDKLWVRSGSRIEGLVDGGEGVNGAYLDDPAGGTFNGATRMNLWVANGEWTLTGPIKNSEMNQVYSDATLINQSSVSGKTTVERGATYSGGTADQLDVAGTLQMGPATRIDKDLDMQPGSTLAFTPGADETVSVGNTATLSGATLNIHVPDENNLPSRPVRLLNAERIEGQFANVTSNLENLIPVLTYKSHEVFVTFKPKEPTPA